MKITIDTAQGLTPQDRDLLTRYLGMGAPSAASVLEGTSRGTEAPPADESTPEPPKAEETPKETPEEPNKDFDSLLATAVENATRMVGAGRADQVRAALKSAGLARVSAISTMSELAAFEEALQS